jgi:hypothetical protein
MLRIGFKWRLAQLLLPAHVPAATTASEMAVSQISTVVAPQPAADVKVVGFAPRTPIVRLVMSVASGIRVWVRSCELFSFRVPGLNPRCLSHSANAAVLSPYYLPTFVTLTGILATQFRGPAVTALTSAISSQIGLQLGTALSPPAVYVTGVVSGVLSTTLSVNFVVAASTLQQGAYIVAGLTYVFVRWRTVEESGVMGSMCVWLPVRIKAI